MIAQESRAGKNIASKSKAGEKGVIKMQARRVGCTQGYCPETSGCNEDSAVGRGNAALKGMKKKQQAATKLEQSHAAEQLVRASRGSKQRQQRSMPHLVADGGRELKRKQTASLDHSHGRSIAQRQVQKIGSPPICRQNPRANT